MWTTIKKHFIFVIFLISIILSNNIVKANSQNSIIINKDVIAFATINKTILYKYDDNSVLAMNKGDIFELVEYKQKGNSKVLCNEKIYEVPTSDIELKLIQDLPDNYLDIVEKFKNTNKIITFLYKEIGKPYKLGDTGPLSYDCSGLIQTAFKEVGIDISRVSYTQVKEGTRVKLKNILIGDLTFFNMKNDSGHVGIYIGNNEIIHASPNGGVKISKLKYMDNFNEIRRVMYWKIKDI